MKQKTRRWTTLGLILFLITGFSQSQNNESFTLLEKSGKTTLFIRSDFKKMTFTKGKLHMKMADEGKMVYPFMTIQNITFNGIETKISNPRNEPENLFNLYPSHVKNYLHVKWNTEIEGNITLSIFNTHGQLLSEKTMSANTENSLATLNTSNLKNGLYLLKCEGNKTSQTIKFIKN